MLAGAMFAVCNLLKHCVWVHAHISTSMHLSWCANRTQPRIPMHDATYFCYCKEIGGSAAVAAVMQAAHIATSTSNVLVTWSCMGGRSSHISGCLGFAARKLLQVVNLTISLCPQDASLPLWQTGAVHAVFCCASQLFFYLQSDAWTACTPDCQA